MEIYVLSPVVGPTGGTELLQQFCSQINKLGGKAFMMYLSDPVDKPIYNKFNPIYENPYVVGLIDKPGCCVVIPEHFAGYVSRFRHSKTAIWWMSVDNYWGVTYQADGYSHKDVYRISRRLAYKPVHLLNLRQFKKCIHFYQSEYARLYITDKLNIDASRVYPLSDFIDLRYKADEAAVKGNTILYNPKKGIKYTKQLINSISDYEWVPLQGMSFSELLATMQKAKLYVDFGAHPGKDRLPREAATCGCCVVTGMRGAAANDVDIPIPGFYKFGDFNIDQIRKTIDFVMNNYDKATLDFLEYRRSIAEELDCFQSECANAISLFNTFNC